MSPTVTPYGDWVSPMSAHTLATAFRRLSFPTLVGDEVWWAEDRPAEAGRTAVMARRGGGSGGRTSTGGAGEGTVVELLPAPWNARSRVHEYGGRSFVGVPGAAGPALVFANFNDQRLYRLDRGADTPVPLTPVPQRPAELRYADLVPAAGGSEIWCVRERHHGDDLDRHVVAVPVDGRAANDPTEVCEIVGGCLPAAGGSRFVANPRLSPDGTRLAWLAWDHPNMPWDGTELRVGALDGNGRVAAWTTVLGVASEAVFQPEWADEQHLIAASDRTGWWNLYRMRAPDLSKDPDPAEHPARAEVVPLHPAAEEFGAALWQLGAATWGRLADGRLLCIHGTGTQRLGVLDPATGALSDLDLPYQSYTAALEVAGDRAVVVAGAPTTASAVVEVDVPRGRAETIRTAIDPAALPDPSYLPVAESTSLAGPDGRDIHVHIYPPRSPDHTGPPGAKPPYAVFVHGGPTSNSPAVLDLAKAYFTSRGIGVLDVNYGGSTGYGRAYRERLTGQWGVVDLEDATAAASALVARGDADPDRLAIRGGSAGGWTTLCAVTSTGVFAAGTSLFGVADVRRLAATTHDFESRYVATLVGEGTDGGAGAGAGAGGDGGAGEGGGFATADLRSPLHRAGQTRCPVLLLQGADDPIVPQEQAEQFRDALEARGIPHALLIFAGEQHGFRKAESIVASVEAELSFYGQVMGFTPPGVATLPLSRSPGAHRF